MPKRLFHPTPCPLCGSTATADYKVVYPANFQQTDITKLFSARRLPDQIHAQIVSCLRDGQVRSTPVLAKSALDRLYQKSEFNYQHEVGNLTATYIKALELVLPYLKRTDRILEVGCGNGFVLAGLQKLGYEQVFGVEPSQEAVSLADPRLKARIKIAPFSRSIFPKRSFRCIFLMQTLDHIPNPTQFLADCSALLEPGGYLLSYHHNVESWSAKIFGESSPIFDIEHTYLYSHRTTKLLLEKNGFLVCKLISPKNVLSAYHLWWLIPISTSIKALVLRQKSFAQFLQKIHFQLPLGNTCVLAQKPS